MYLSLPPQGIKDPQLVVFPCTGKMIQQRLRSGTIEYVMAGFRSMIIPLLVAFHPHPRTCVRIESLPIEMLFNHFSLEEKHLLLFYNFIFVCRWHQRLGPRYRLLLLWVLDQQDWRCVLFTGDERAEYEYGFLLGLSSVISLFLNGSSQKVSLW